jgi:arginine-tRNA-protein transferase
LFRVVEEPRHCSYLPAETASLEYRVVTSMRPAEYEELLARGYRRFGYQLFRPQCPRCEQCVSLRILVQQFTPNRQQRRVLRRNAHIRAERRPVYVTDQHLALFDRYHSFMAEHRRWEYDPISRDAYLDSFVVGSNKFASQWLYFDRDRLVGVALMDETPGAISMVYYFHEPEWRPLSPGTFSILTQLLYAKQKNIRYAYPGYWIAANRSMRYKIRYRPHEILTRHPADEEQPQWTSIELR